MLFQHTLKTIISGEKTQTSRRWKDDYIFSWSDYEEPNQVVLSQKAWDVGKIRKLYHVGQTLAVQPARGKKSIGRIEITSLAKRSVIHFTSDDIRREGFNNSLDFYLTWLKIHNPKAYSNSSAANSESLRRLYIEHALLSCDMALVIGFKLVEVY